MGKAKGPRHGADVGRFGGRSGAQAVIDGDDVEGGGGRGAAVSCGGLQEGQRVRATGNREDDGACLPLEARQAALQTARERVGGRGGRALCRQQLLAAASACSFFFTLALIWG
jgi:hypothetical protein